MRLSRPRLALALAPALLAAGGCVIPNALELEADAGGTRPPVIDRERTTPALYELTRQTDDDDVDFFVWVKDPDSLVLSVNLFLDGTEDAYGAPVPVSKQTHTFTDSSTVNGMNFRVTGICGGQALNQIIALELWVSDGGFVTSGDQRKPLQADGNTDSVMWQLLCVPPAL